MIDFEFFEKHGLSQAEIAHALGVSRVTINLWRNGRMKPHRYHVDDVIEKAQSLRAAVERGLIPPKKSKMASRNDAITRALAAVETTV